MDRLSMETERQQSVYQSQRNSLSVAKEGLREKLHRSSRWETVQFRDLAFLNKQARENLQVPYSRTLPEQYQKCLNGLTQVLKMAWNIVIIDSVNQTTKLQALSLISDCYKYQMDLTTNGVVVTDAIKYVNSKMDHINNQEKKLLQDIKKEAEEEGEELETSIPTTPSTETEEQPTHNRIF